LRDLAPPLPATRLTVPVETFAWRLQTDADQADFLATLRGEGNWEPVTIPHYGGPLGRATAYYRTTVQVTEAMLAQGALFVCCRGIDYKAQVFFNGTLLGTHEGFFAPFEFDATTVARLGENTLLIVVENDAICMGNDSWGDDGDRYEGDKIYAATGPGYDDPAVGWHHCPPGMGIYQAVTLEARAPVHVHDLFVRLLSLDGAVEAWIEVWNCHRTRQGLSLPLARRQVTPLACTIERGVSVGRGELVLTTGDPLVFWSLTPRDAPKMDDLVIGFPLILRFHAQRVLHT
jgi:hypothetical protein